MQTIRTELYDKIHNVINNYNDRMVHAVFKYDFELDAKILQDVLVHFFDTTPLLHSSFRKGIFTHRWVVRNFTAGDILTVVNYSDAHKSVDAFLCQSIPLDCNVQLKVMVFNKNQKSTLAVITNHMCMDGGDLKYFLKMLCKAYTAHSNGKDYKYILKNGSRSYKTVYNDFDKDKRNTAKKLFSNPTPANSLAFPLSLPDEKDTSFIITREIPADKFRAFKAYGKCKNATVNDMILAAYFISLYEFCEFDKTNSVTISSAIDLRRHMSDSEKTGITNHSSYLPFTLDSISQGFEGTLKKVTEISKKYNSDPFTGLHGLPLLNFAYRVFPAVIADKLVKKYYNNPYIALSNIGILYEDFYLINGSSPVSAFITGTVKYKPGVMVTVTTYKNQVTLSMCSKGNESDKEKLKEFLLCFEKNLLSITKM